MEIERVKKACDLRVASLDQALKNADHRGHRGEKAYLMIRYKEVCEWKIDVLASIAKIESRIGEHNADANSVEIVSLLAPQITTSQAHDETLFGGEEQASNEDVLADIEAEIDED